MNKQFIQVVDVLATSTIIALLGVVFIPASSQSLVNFSGGAGIVFGCAWGITQYMRVCTAISSLCQSYIFDNVAMFIGVLGIALGYSWVLFMQGDITQVGVTVSVGATLLFMGCGSIKVAKDNISKSMQNP